MRTLHSIDSRKICALIRFGIDNLDIAQSSCRFVCTFFVSIFFLFSFALSPDSIRIVLETADVQLFCFCLSFWFEVSSALGKYNNLLMFFFFCFPFLCSSVVSELCLCKYSYRRIAFHHQFSAQQHQHQHQLNKRKTQK